MYEPMKTTREGKETGGRDTDSGSGRVHDVFYTGGLNESLDVGDLGGDGGGGGSDLFVISEFRLLITR